MDITLNDVVQHYLDDANWQAYVQTRTLKRNAPLPRLREVTQRFVRGDIDLRACRDQLDAITREQERWGVQGYGFMGTLSVFVKHHEDKGPVVEPFLRSLLSHLDATTMGAQIEALYKFLQEEKTRLRREGKSSREAAAPGNSALIVSAFTAWLDTEHCPVIYYEGVRKGIRLLYKADLLPKTENLVVNNDTIEVKTEAHHQACVQVLNAIDPRIKTSLYWSEFFLYWVLEHFRSLTAPANVLRKEDETSALAAQVAITGTLLKEAEPEYTLALPDETERNDGAAFIPPGPLKPTPGPILAELIPEVQKHILVDEATIRRIYQALLAGHVILAGPPGTGKTELARLIPEILWRRKLNDDGEEENQENEEATEWDTKAAYTTRLVTANGEWSVRTLIGGIAPQNKDGSLTYTIQYGHLTTTILKNWSFNSERPDEWNTLRRTTSLAPSGIKRGEQSVFRGQWLVIDEFNRAPIDIAFGEALTALSSNGHEALRVPIEGGTAELPIPQDFRIIGTLNSFDRTFLNQISEALKRRFAFIEVLPLSRVQSEAEQAIVLYKALLGLRHLDEEAIELNEDRLGWHGGAVSVSLKDDGHYAIDWETEDHPFRSAFETAWRLFEVLRIYRQMGTAQALSFVRQILVAGLVQDHTTHEQWIEQAVDVALCDTLADQLQILLPDEIDVLCLYLTSDPALFPTAYNNLLARLPRNRVHAQLLKLGGTIHRNGLPTLADQEIDQILAQERPAFPEEHLKELFHLDYPVASLPQFSRRLRTFKVERGL